MRKLLIVVGVILVAVVAVVAIAAMNLNSFLNRNKEWLGQQVEAAIGRKVEFSEIGLSLSGGFGVRIQGLRVADDPAFSKEDFVRADDVQVAVKILPTLMGRPEVKRVVLLAPQIRVIKTKDGNNYDSIGKKPAPPAAAPPPSATPVAPPQPASGSEKAAFVVALIDVRDGDVSYLDKTTSPPTDLKIRDLDFSASDVSFDTPIRLKLETALFGATKQNVSLEGTIGPLGAQPDLQKANLDLELRLGPIVVDELKKIEAAKKSIPPELSMPDPIVFEATAKGTMAALALTAKLDADDAAIRYGETFQKPKGVPLRFEVSADRAGEKLDVKKLLLKLAKLDLEGKGTVTTGPAGAIDFTIDSKKTPLAGWEKLLPAFTGHDVSGDVEVHVRAQGKTGGGEVPKLNGTVALTGVSAKQQGSPYEIEGLTTKIELRGEAISLPKTDFRLSGSPVSISAEVASLKPVTATFALASPSLSAASLNFASPTAAKPEVLRGLDIKGRFRAGEKGSAPEFQGTVRSADGSLRGFDYQALAADLSLRDQVAVLDKLELRAFDGTYDGGGRYDMKDPESPRFDFRSKVRDMDLKALLASQQSSFQEKISGRLDADIALDGSGKAWDRIKNTLRGSGRVDVRDGVLRDVNLADQVLQSVTGIGGLSNLISPRVRKKYPDIFSTGDTKFEKLGGSVQIADRVARTDDVALAARDYAILGRGAYDLDNQLDFVLTLVASRQLSEDIISDVKEVKYIANPEGKIEIPFRLTGALPNVKPKPDSEFITRAVSRAVVEKGAEKLGEKIFGKPKPGKTPKPEEELLRKGLEGLFGR